MKQVLIQIQNELKKSNNDSLHNEQIGRNITIILINNTNLTELKNPINCIRKIISMFMQSKNVDQVFRFTRLVGLKINKKDIK